MQMNEFFYRGNEPHWLKNDERQRPHGYAADFDHPSSGRSLPTYEFKVPMCCGKCEEKVREELSEMDGVYEIFADQLSERVTVAGFIDPFQALKKMKRIKKKSKFWNGRVAAQNSSYRDDRSSYKKPHSRKQETVYRTFPSQVSYNREPPRSSSSRFKNKYGSYDDEISYSSLRHGGANRNMFYDDDLSYSRLRPASANRNVVYDDEVSHSRLRPSSANRNVIYDDEVSYSRLRPASANRNMIYDDDMVSYSRLRPASANRNMYYPGSFCDDEVSYSGSRPYRNKFYGSYDDEISYSDLRPSSSYMPAGYRYGDSLPRSQLFRHETVPPFAQEYDTEYPVEEYLFY